MFTGIIHRLGRVVKRDGPRLEVEGALGRVKKGDSIAVNGACLTAVKISGTAARRRVAFDLSEETLRCTTIGRWKPGAAVNWEPALRAGDALGGHFVQGHVDAVGRLVGKRPGEGWTLYTFEAPAEVRPYLAPKGSVAVDGVSLTVAGLDKGFFTVAVIPHTEKHTTLGAAAPGAVVNLEADVIAKHVAGLLAARGQP